MTIWSGGVFESKQDIVQQFCGDNYTKAKAIIADLNDAEIIIGFYEVAGYEGNAWVLYEKSGTLYEVNAQHCSCFGLEGQWEPEETSLAQLAMKNFYWSDVLKGELSKFLESRSGAA
jgi:hypothetical protein